MTKTTHQHIVECLTGLKNMGYVIDFSVQTYRDTDQDEPAVSVRFNAPLKFIHLSEIMIKIMFAAVTHP